MLQAMLFDMDGLLIDTEDLHLRAFAEIATNLGYPSHPEEYVDWIGRPTGDLPAWLNQRIPKPVPAAEIKHLESQAFLRILEDERPEPLLGAREMVDLCDELGLRRGLVSNSKMPLLRKVMAVVLKHLERPPELERTFGTVVTADRVQCPKPDPEPFLLAARELNVPPEACLVLEDSPTGAAGGRAAGCQVLAVPSPFLPREQTAAFAHWVCDSLLEAYRTRPWEQTSPRP
jgi:HAD superfamily hydrolase (TIGR01509 family)